MNNEITIVSDQRGQLGRPVDPWASAPPYGGAAPQQQAHSSILKKIHRLLRGRYPLAITLALICGGIAGVAGWMSRKPMYESFALIEIKTSIPNLSPTQNDTSISDPGSFLQAQISAMQSPDTVRAAMQRPEWTALHPGGISDDLVNAFLANLTVEKVIPTNLIRMTYADVDPHSAKAGAVALSAEYINAYQHSDVFDRNGRLNLLTQKNTTEQNNLTNLDSEIQQTNVALGEYADVTYAAAQAEQLVSLETQQQDAETRIDQMKAALGQSSPSASTSGGTAASSTAAAAPPFVPLTPDQLAQMPGGTYMVGLLGQRAELQAKVQEEKDTNGENSYAAQEAQEQVNLLNARISAYANSMNGELASRKTLPVVNSPGSPIVNGQVTQADLDNAQDALTRLDTTYSAKLQALQKYHSQQIFLDTLKEERDSTKATVDKLNDEIGVIQDQLALEADQVTVAGPPALPSAPSDHKREILAAVGFLGGGSLPVGILLLIGVLDQRFRFSDETNNEMTGIPLLGILPNLPDLLSDPEQAATAAHCVHQIRTLMQINGHVTDRRAYCVTSGSSGDGKTSLTLALGLSFAASGSRTLMIDADLVGGGLSSRLGIRSDKGVLDAMSTRSLAECIKPTDVADLSLLPIGHAMGSFAGTISPAALRRLVAEARKQYDIVLIDTGPILGSIEASPVAAAADAVILCVSRGQQRPLVDRALAHLQSIGARLAGVVFNRAQARDFEMSVSRSINQSQQAGHGHNGTNGANGSNGSRNGHSLGPVAKAVATSVRPVENEPN